MFKVILVALSYCLPKFNRKCDFCMWNLAQQEFKFYMQVLNNGLFVMSGFIVF